MLATIGFALEHKLEPGNLISALAASATLQAIGIGALTLAVGFRLRWAANAWSRQAKTARVGEAATGKQLAQMNGQSPSRVNTAEFSLDGQRVVTASRDGTAAIYKVVSSSDVKKLFSMSPQKNPGT